MEDCNCKQEESCYDCSHWHICSVELEGKIYYGICDVWLKKTDDGYVCEEWDWQSNKEMKVQEMVKKAIERGSKLWSAIG